LGAQIVEALSRAPQFHAEASAIRRSIPVDLATRRRSRQISEDYSEEYLIPPGTHRSSLDLTIPVPPPPQAIPPPLNNNNLIAENNNARMPSLQLPPHLYHPLYADMSSPESLFSISESRRHSKAPTRTVILRRPTITIQEGGRILIGICGSALVGSFQAHFWPF
jgi:hypothetical protein